MKTTALIPLLCTLSFICKAQKIKENDVPSVVKENFFKAYPGATGLKWEREKERFEAEFKNNRVENSVVLDASGNIVEVEKEISAKDLPAAISEYVNQHYKGSKIKEATVITDHAGETTYEAEVGNKDLIFDSTGKFLRIESDEHAESDKKK